MKRQVFDETFKQMAVELSNAKGSVKIAAQELGIDPSRLSKWRQNQKEDKIITKEKPTLTAEQLEIRRLQKELKEAQLERDILKKAVSIFSKGDSRYSGL
jgi:transposase